MSSATTGWWREQRLADGAGLRWCSETFTLSVARAGAEWRVARVTGDETLDRPSTIRLEESDNGAQGEPDDGDIVERHVLSRSLDRARCLPAAADRSVVVRPVTRLSVAPGEEARIFVSSPVWLRLQAGEPWQTLYEGPSRRLSDTWFGPSNIDGELAYALRTPAETEPERAGGGTCRLWTPVVIRNRAHDALPVERLSLPVPFLATYADRDGGLWTEQVTMTRTEDAEMASFKVEPGAPREASGAELLCAARRSASGNVLVRAFTGILHVFGGGDD